MSREAYAAAIRDARVGGAFWTDDSPWRGGGPLLCDDPTSEEACVAWLAGRPVVTNAGGEVDGVDVFQTAVAATHGGADGFDDDGFTHGTLLRVGRWTFGIVRSS